MAEKSPTYPNRNFSVLTCAVMLVGLTLAPLAIGEGAGASQSRLASGSLCKKVSIAEVASTLGLKVTKVTTVVNGNVTLCWYQVGTVSHSVYVRTQKHDSLSGFKADLRLAKTYSENPVTDPNFKPYPAFSTSVGSSTFGYTYTVTLLKKSTQLGVGASNVTLGKVEGLAKKVTSLL